MGFGCALYYHNSEKRFIRLDSVTLKQNELASLIEAVNVVKEKSTDQNYFRYESNSGNLAFECPNSETCNLEVPSRDPSQPKQWHRTVQIEESRKKLSYEDLGLENGDVISGINGKAVNSPSFAISELQRLLNQTGALHELTIVRDGQSKKITFNLGTAP